MTSPQIDSRVTIDTASPADLTAILDLLRANSLPQEGLADHVATALVLRSEQGVVGCAALEMYGRAALLRSVAVAADWRGQGLGQRLTEAALDLARQQAISHVYLLTETAATFFPKLGFSPVERANVPAAVQRSLEFTHLCADSATAMELRL